MCKKNYAKPLHEQLARLPSSFESLEETAAVSANGSGDSGLPSPARPSSQRLCKIAALQRREFTPMCPNYLIESIHS